MEQESFCDVSKIYLSPINKNLAKEMIVKNHYSHKYQVFLIFHRYMMKVEYFTFLSNKLI